MRRMARRAAFLFHRNMFESKRSHRLGMAIRADWELAGSGPQLMLHKSSVWVMAIAALHQSHVHAMAIRPAELCLLCRVTAVAQQGLLGLQQIIRLSRMMRRVAPKASHSVSQVDGAAEIHVLQAGLVTLQAALARLLWRQL